MRVAKIFVYVSALVLLLAACGGAGGLSAGSKVIAQWSFNRWYSGVVEGPCEGGFTVKWDDGSDPACVVSAEVKPVKALVASDAKAGAAVFLKDSSGTRYEIGTVGAAEGSMYKVDFPEGGYEADVTLDRLFVR